jgi:hypothetical protein
MLALQAVKSYARRMSKKLSGFASQGGRARASVLTSDERKAIARTAALARWAGKSPSGEQASAPPGESKTLDISPPSVEPALPIALFPGKLKMGGAEFAVYVLDNGKRVMAQREVVRVLTGKRETGKLHLQAQALKGYIDADEVARQTLQFSIPGTQYLANGFEATLLLDVCDAFLRAREENRRALTPNQIEIAKQAEIITRACAKVGIIALIDEATGYQAFRKKQELQLKLQAFIAEDLQEWALMFPQEFWFELARLEGIHYSPRSRPLRWGKYIMAFVYDAIDGNGEVGRELRRKNPDPHFKQNHHQWLKEFGRSKIHDQVERVTTIMKLCDDMEDFKKKFARVFKRSAIDPQLSFSWDIGR